MKRSIIIVIALVSLITGFYIYSSLGGNQEVVLAKEEKTFVIIGEHYDGVYNSSEVESIFSRAREHADQLGAKLAVVNYGSDSEAKQVSQFIGVVLDGDSQPSDDNEYERRTFAPTYVIKATIQAHNFVMPKPGNVRTLANEFDTQSSEPLSDTTIEIYSSDRELNVYFLRQ